MKNAVFKTKPHCKVSRMVAGLSAAICLAVPALTRADAAYADDFIETSDSTVRSIALPSGIAYVFANPDAGEVSVSLKADMTLKRLLVVGGGGGGGGWVSGGGGGGGVIAIDESTSLASESLIRLSVGKGGGADENGGDSSLAFADKSYVAVGGGAGGAGYGVAGKAGGSGGGAAGSAVGGSGTSGQGFGGGSWTQGSNAGCGGGGATEGGSNGSTTQGGRGGEGLTSDITGESVVYGSGGGGGGNGGLVGGVGGTNAGDGGGSNNGNKGTDGVAGTGGGGGGDSFGLGAGYPGKGGCGAIILLVQPKAATLLVENDNADVPSTAVAPAIGMHSLTAGAVLTATDWTNEESSFQGACLGYSVRYYDTATETWGEAMTSEDTSFTCPETDCGGVWITWHWKVSLAGTAYSDDFLETTDGTVRSVVLPTGVAYVFANPEAGNVKVLLKADMNLKRLLVVGGGGGGGGWVSGGGGGGGVIAIDESTSLASESLIRLSVGKGGGADENGGDSSFAFADKSYVAVGGGAGGAGYGVAGKAGGSGGGAAGSAVGGSGTSGQGCGGGSYSSSSAGCGGGGATQTGHGGGADKGGGGGEGLACDITGELVVYGSGGGGGGNGGRLGGKGGTNAGDGGGTNNGHKGTDGVAGTGGGGGGDSFGLGAGYPGKGGCGTVILFVKPKTAMAIVDNNQPLVPATAVEPAAGAHAFAEGAVMRALDWSDPDTLVKGRCIGYEVRPYDPATGDWGVPVTSEETVFTVPSSLQGGFKLTWRWEVSLEDDACFRDRLAECSTTPTLKKRIRLDDETCEYVYAFSDPDSGTVSLLLKKEATLLRTLVVGGGGGGGGWVSGGGGGGGVIARDEVVPLAQNSLVRLSVGAGGSGGQNGGDSSLAFADKSYMAVGGGAGGAGYGVQGCAGGSGGGAAGAAVGGSATPGQGNGGGSFSQSSAGCGGGGATQAGHGGGADRGGGGGEGFSSDITGEPVVYGSGGGGGGYGGRLGGKGGTNAGDGGGSDNGDKGTDGVAGTGGGGGGDSFGLGAGYPGKGGSGAVILRLRVKESRTGVVLILR